MTMNFTAADIPDLSGKTMLVTGANTGVGFEAAKAFASHGARVLLGCRNAAKGNDAVARITAAHADADVALVELDLADLASVRRAAETVAQEPRLDALVNNAGVMWNPKTLTADGFESQFGVNHLGHFALTCLLLPTLEATQGSRVVTTASSGHKAAKGLFFDDINAEADYHPRKRYFASKLANLLFTYELDRRLRAKGSGTIAVAVHPGGSDTDLVRHLSKFESLMWRAMRPLVNSAEEGAWSAELAATAPGVEGGQYFGPSKFGELSGPAKQVKSSKQSKDPDMAKRLWDLSIEMTGIDPGI